MSSVRVWWRGTATPSVGGYLVAWAVSVVAVAVEMALALGVSGDGTGAISVFVLALVFGGILSLVLAPPGILLAHLLCRRITSQAAQVVVVAGVGALAGLVFELVLGGGLFYGLVPVLALATGVGRVAVVPMTRRRTEAADFAVPVPGC